jgi:hypothetical protein
MIGEVCAVFAAQSRAIRDRRRPRLYGERTT